MYEPDDLSTKTIQDLFYRQIRMLTMKTNGIDSFDLQFSDRWQEFSV